MNGNQQFIESFCSFIAVDVDDYLENKFSEIITSRDPQLSALAVMGQDSYDVCMKCNRSVANSPPQDLINFYHPRLLAPLRIQDVSRLPEEDYIQEAGEQRGLNRDDRNLFPVSCNVLGEKK